MAVGSVDGCMELADGGVGSVGGVEESAGEGVELVDGGVAGVKRGCEDTSATSTLCTLISSSSACLSASSFVCVST